MKYTVIEIHADATRAPGDYLALYTRTLFITPRNDTSPWGVATELGVMLVDWDDFAADETLLVVVDASLYDDGWTYDVFKAFAWHIVQGYAPEGDDD